MSTVVLKISDIWETFKKRPTTNKIICSFLIISILSYCFVGAIQFVLAGNIIEHMKNGLTQIDIWLIVSVIFIIISFLGIIAIVSLDLIGEQDKARLVVRGQLAILVISVVFFTVSSGYTSISVLYLFQFTCLVIYQLYTDPTLNFNAPWRNPFSKLPDENSSYMQLNFFNLFWVFIVASVIGLLVETGYRFFAFNILEDRAGLLWGPFSPIYGIGAVLATIALNRLWNKKAWLVILVSAIVGCTCEWFVSWYFQTVFGISAWDYTGSIGTIDGRTDISHAIVWGIYGFLWIRLFLPVIMKFVDSIKPKWRAILTSMFFIIIMFDSIMTLMAIDCWSQRKNGNEPQDTVQVFFAENFNDDYMAQRFQTMTIKGKGHPIQTD